jgi:16S rRNA processing protein RimM
MGRIAAPHGVRGAMKVKPQSADASSLIAYREWWLRAHASVAAWTAYAVQAVREQSGMLVVELSGVNSREQAAALRGADVGVPRAQLPPLAEDEHYQADLIGVTVVNREGTPLGVVIGFVESGAHPILRVRGDAGIERLIPWVGQYIDRVDAHAGRIDVDWPADY